MPDGAWFVGLESVTDTDRGRHRDRPIARPVRWGRAPGRRGAPRVPGRTVAAPRPRQLRAGRRGRRRVAALLRASPGSRFIVTSRAPLHVAGEHEYPVRPLSVDEAGDRPTRRPRLFIDRARAVRPGLGTRPDAPIVTEICQSDAMVCRSGSSSLRPACPSCRSRRSATVSRPDRPCPERSARRTRTPADPRTEPSSGATTCCRRPISERSTSSASSRAPSTRDRSELVLGPSRRRVGLTCSTRWSPSPSSRSSRGTRIDRRRRAPGGHRDPVRDAQDGPGVRPRPAARGRSRAGRARSPCPGLSRRSPRPPQPNLNTSRQPAWLDRLALRRRQHPGRPPLVDRGGRLSSRARFLGRPVALLVAARSPRRGCADGSRPVFAMPGRRSTRHVPRVWALSAAGGIAYWRAETGGDADAGIEPQLEPRDGDRRRARDRRRVLQSGVGPVHRRRPVRVARATRSRPGAASWRWATCGT